MTVFGITVSVLCTLTHYIINRVSILSYDWLQSGHMLCDMIRYSRWTKKCNLYSAASEVNMTFYFQFGLLPFTRSHPASFCVVWLIYNEWSKFCEDGTDKHQIQLQVYLFTIKAWLDNKTNIDFCWGWYMVIFICWKVVFTELARWIFKIQYNFDIY